MEATDTQIAILTTCAMCGGDYIAMTDDGTVNELHRLCQDCRDRDYLFGLMKVVNANDRAARLGLPATLTLPQWMETVTYFHYLCAYCRDEGYDSLDHLLPVVRGGGTVEWNCVPCCLACNKEKGGMPVLEWVHQLRAEGAWIPMSHVLETMQYMKTREKKWNNPTFSHTGSAPLSMRA